MSIGIQEFLFSLNHMLFLTEYVVNRAEELGLSQGSRRSCLTFAIGFSRVLRFGLLIGAKPQRCFTADIVQGNESDLLQLCLVV